MPRNTLKYAYVSLSIDRDSLLYGELIKDAAISGLPLSDVILMRLSDQIRQRVEVDISVLGSPERSFSPPAIPEHTGSYQPAQSMDSERSYEEVDIEEYSPERAKKLALNAISAFDEF